MSEVIEHEKTGLLFQPGNSENLLEALQWMADLPTRAKSLRANVRKVYEQRYTVDRNCQLLLEIYRQAIHESKESKAVGS